MSIANESINKDVKELRTNFKDVKNQNRFKKSLFHGYNVKETNSYLSSIETNRELEKNAFLDRIKELELFIDTIKKESDKLELSTNNMKSQLKNCEAQFNSKDEKINAYSQQINEYELLIDKYEKELQEKPDEVILKENANLKSQLSQAIAERNDYAGQCKILENEHEININRLQKSELEITTLTDKLASHIRASREQFIELSLIMTKIIESNSFLNDKTITSLKDLLYYNENFKKEAIIMTNDLKQKLELIYK